MNKILKFFSRLSENNRIILKNVVGTFIVKGISVVISLIIMPIYLNFFENKTILGLWFTILSVLTWILNFDLGIGNGLRNKLTECFTKKDFRKAKDYLSSAYISIAVVCAVFSIIFLYVFDYIDWNVIFNINEEIISRKTLAMTIKIVFIGIMLQMFFKLITSFLYAIQKSAVNNLLSLITSIIIAVSLILFSSRGDENNIVYMSLINVFAVIIPLIISTIFIFSKKKFRPCVPSISSFNLKYTQDILSLGGRFLFVQIMYMFIMNTNEYLITLFYENDFVVEYQIYYKLFTLGGIVFSLALMPIWSTVTKSYIEGDIIWIKKIMNRLLYLSLIGTVLQFSIIPFLKIILNIWIGNGIVKINLWYGISFAILGSLLMVNGALASIANGIGELRTQSICFTIGAFLKVFLIWILSKYISSWIVVIWMNIVCLAVYCLSQPFMINKYFDNRN